MTPEA
jgi:hypothetical protein